MEEFNGLSWEEVMANEEYASNPYISTYYFTGLYVYELLVTGYGVDESR